MRLRSPLYEDISADIQHNGRLRAAEGCDIRAAVLSHVASHAVIMSAMSNVHACVEPGLYSVVDALAPDWLVIFEVFELCFPCNKYRHTPEHHSFARPSISQALRVEQTSSIMALVRDTVNFLKFEAQNWWSSLTWTEDSIPDLGYGPATAQLQLAVPAVSYSSRGGPNGGQCLLLGSL